MPNSVYPGRTIRNDHGGPLTASVHRILTGLFDGDGAKALIDMLRSEEEIDVHTRRAIADALERDLEDRMDTVRLRFVRPDGGGTTWSTNMDRMLDLQNIADEVYALRAAGLTRQQAIGNLTERKIAGRTKIEEALAYSKRAMFRITRNSAPVRT